MIRRTLCCLILLAISVPLSCPTPSHSGHTPTALRADGTSPVPPVPWSVVEDQSQSTLQVDGTSPVPWSLA
jgi:hypothetical protein